MIDAINYLKGGALVKRIPDFELADQVVMAAIRLTRTLRALTKTSALTGPEISALAVIVYAGRITGKDLAALEEVTPGAISRTVAGLESAGLVRRAADAADSRVKWIAPTAKGAALTRDGHHNRLAPLAAGIAGLTAQERRTLSDAAALIDRLARRIAEPDGAARR